jgi:molybdopterin/thiamine biosynthesis adenylyltransferase
MGERYSRNEALFGASGQARISAAKVTIVGLGGLGSHVAQQLAYLGVVDYALVDFDVVTESSLNRLVGAVPADVAAHTKKVDVGARTIRSVQPEANVATIDGRITDIDAERVIARADVVFGCLDRDIHRLELLEVITRHAKPCFDLATDVIGEGEDLAYGGRMVLCDGTRCLVCLPDLLDQEAIARDRLSPDLRDADRRIYGVNRDDLAGTGPAVVSINGVVASLSVTEFMVLVTGLRQPAPQLTYRADVGTVRRSTDQPAADCYYCSGLWRTGADMERAGSDA